jgi:molybdopterin-binding protein
MLKGKVVSVTPGVVNAEVVIEVAGGTQIVSIITKTSAESMMLAPGMDVWAVIKASNVIVGTE